MAEELQQAAGRCVLTVLGADRSGIVAEVAGVLALAHANILDIDQTILQGIFTMTMLVDVSQATASFSELQERYAELAQSLGVQITIQREEVFTYMYRL